MPLSTSLPLSDNMPHVVRWTRDDCQKLEDAGVLTYKYELIEGVIYKLGQKFPHNSGISRLFAWMLISFGTEYVMSQASIDLKFGDNATNEPVPDGVVLNHSWVGMNRLAKPDDIALLIEVSDSTLAFDLGVKASLYARSGISEYWVIDLNERAIYVHRTPQEGSYTSVKKVVEHNTVSSLSKPEISTLVSEFMP